MNHICAKCELDKRCERQRDGRYLCSGCRIGYYLVCCTCLKRYNSAQEGTTDGVLTYCADCTASRRSIEHDWLMRLSTMCGLSDVTDLLNLCPLRSSDPQQTSKLVKMLTTGQPQLHVQQCAPLETYMEDSQDSDCTQGDLPSQPKGLSDSQDVIWNLRRRVC